jgi:fructose-1,6-bisphosphatase/inositol monophosphatase family enzyme
MLHSALINVMVKAARRAGRSLKRDLGEIEHLQVSLKGPANFVTMADKRAEEMLYTDLAKARPGYGFIGEEGGTREGADKSHTWIVDPLDGTTNFLHGIPQFAISIGLQREGTIIAGVIYNPANDELYIAERGKGAFLNDQRLRVAGRRKLDECVIACGLPHIGRGDLRCRAGDDRNPGQGGGPAPVRRRLARHGLRRRRPPRRLLGTQSAALGHGGRTDHRARSRRHRQRHRGRRRPAEDRARDLRQ